MNGRVGTLVISAVLILVGCKSEKRDAPGSSAAPTTPTAAACETLDRAQCLRATHCTMHWIESSTYECRTSKGSCEIDLAQTDKGTCESRQDCTWKPGECYCPFPGYGKTQVEDKENNSGGACACGGGAPPRCIAAAD